jgi:hypothetical protein
VSVAAEKPGKPAQTLSWFRMTPRAWRELEAAGLALRQIKAARPARCDG